MYKLIGLKVKTESCSRCNKPKPILIKGICRSCDIGHKGRWFLSYISNEDYIRIMDNILDGCAYGRTCKNSELPDENPVYCLVDKKEKTLFHAVYDINNMDEDKWIAEYDVWWDQPSMIKIDFRINFNVGVVKK